MENYKKIGRISAKMTYLLVVQQSGRRMAPVSLMFSMNTGNDGHATACQAGITRMTTCDRFKRADRTHLDYKGCEDFVRRAK